MNSITKYLVVYDIVKREQATLAFLKRSKHTFAVTRSDETQSFVDDKTLYLFIEGVKSKNEQSGYSRIVIKRIYEVASEMSNEEMSEFYANLSEIWKSSYLGLHLTGNANNVMQLNPQKLSKMIFSEDIDSASPYQEVFGEEEDGTMKAIPIGASLAEM